MLTYLARGADGCWHWVTTSLAVWAKLPHVAAAGIAWAANCVAPSYHVPPRRPQHVEAPRPFHDPGSTIFYPPNAYEPSGPDGIRRAEYDPRDDDPRHIRPAPEPAGVLVLGVGMLGLGIIRRTRK